MRIRSIPMAIIDGTATIMGYDGEDTELEIPCKNLSSRVTVRR